MIDAEEREAAARRVRIKRFMRRRRYQREAMDRAARWAAYYASEQDAPNTDHAAN